MSCSAYETPSQPCPYCSEPCEADWCDVGVGMVQVGPYFCTNCKASEASAYSENRTRREDYDPATGWYRPGSPLDTLANQDDNLQIVASWSHIEKVVLSAQAWPKYPYPQDRWAILSYVRALQLSQAAPTEVVPAERRAELR